MSSHFREKRLYPRKELLTPIIFEDEFGEPLFSIPCKDISEGGLSLDIADFPVKPGALLFLSFQIPGSQSPIRTTGEVVRRLPQGKTSGGIGVRFVGLSPSAVECLQKWINSEG
ncbi:MAG: hypothetical protein A3I05_01560 [Deltaproteobacteria bacterium RIFCSPLOWO2_02_FULL_44_10]|nr:MAG: hypothetical protein A3C46_05155 [Deltaproteobacteria bacterium RIFCSPHIGHO2_02_FULL_44_16]OGQ45338.1 MAG: hypothetical protein A3I05_01560 [Deltaproteobacteria bacterium RIFCSPLOWO2_02_FULL_44_10]